MSTYVMSDLHGCYDDFQAMLEKIGFSENDQLIIAGDLIERGPQNYEMLRWIEECPQNILLLRGNHEEEFIQNVALMSRICRDLGWNPASAEFTGRIYRSIKGRVRHFDYYKSITGLLQENAVTLRNLQGWALLFQTWPYQYRTTVNGKDYIIVHAGYIEDLNVLPDRREYAGAAEFYLYAREEAYSYGGLPHTTVIAGHTPTMIPSVFTYNKGRVYRYYDEEKDCTYYDIDCGAVFKYWGEAESRMACIRLEDESITYI